MNSPIHYLKIAAFALVLGFAVGQFPRSALSQAPQPAPVFDDGADCLNHHPGSISSLCFCDGKFKPDEDGIIKFPAGLPGCPCVWWHMVSQIGMCGPCDFTCPNREIVGDPPKGIPIPNHQELAE